MNQLKQANSRLCIVRLDETAHWEIKNKPEKIWGVYLVDLNDVTYCCEITPSYLLYFLYNTYSGEEPNEAIDEYVSGYSEDRYIHCSALPVAEGHPVPLSDGLDDSYEEFIACSIEQALANRVF